MIEIENLILRIPNVSPQEGRHMSRQIALKIAEQIPAQHRNYQIDQLDLKIRISENLSNTQIVNRISQAISKRITNGNTLQSSNEIQQHYTESSRRNTSDFLTPNQRRH